MLINLVCENFHNIIPFRIVEENGVENFLKHVFVEVRKKITSTYIRSDLVIVHFGVFVLEGHEKMPSTYQNQP